MAIFRNIFKSSRKSCILFARSLFMNWEQVAEAQFISLVMIISIMDVSEQQTIQTVQNPSITTPYGGCL